MSTDAFAGLDPCVHCGFCLQSCPTFLVTGDEADGPRGRIVLMQMLRNGRRARFDSALTLHLDRCLGCRACEPVCPSGVRYGPALEAARHVLADARGVPLPARVVHAVMAHAGLRRPLLGLARAIRPAAAGLAASSRFGFLFGMLAATKPGKPAGHARRQADAPADAPPPRAPSAPTPAVVFTGCIMSGLFGHVHEATARVLMANGFVLQLVADQGCCGALHAHAGQHEAALALARRNSAAFAALPDDAVIAVNSAGCGAMLRSYGMLLADDPLRREASALAARTQDVTELLAARGPRPGAPLGLRVAYDPPCHLLHAQGVAEAPLAVLDAVPALEQVTHDEADLCCGSAGSYSLVQPELSRQVLARKLAALQVVQPDLVVTGNPGCVMQIGAGLRAARSPIPVVHPLEVLDWSYERAGYYAG